MVVMVSQMPVLISQLAIFKPVYMGKTETAHKLEGIIDEIRFEDQSFFLNALNQEGIRKCITTFYDVVDCLEWLFGKMDKTFLDLIGWDFVIEHVINTGENLGLLLKFLNEEEERELLEKMGWDRVLECIQTIKDFSYILIGMDVGNERTLIEKITTQKLRKVIPFKTDLESLCKHLSPADTKLIREKFMGE